MPEAGKQSARPKPRSLVRRVLFSALRIICASYVLVLLLVYFFQSRLVFMPYRNLEGTPADAGIFHEDVTLNTPDGIRLHAWFVPAPGEARATVLFCHGNAGNISHRIENIRKMHNLHLNTLIFDYRGYGQSTGKATEEGTYLDARAAWDWLTMEKKIPPNRIVVWGQSLGSGVASHLATEVSPAALIMESAFTSVPDAGADHYPFLPVRWLARIKYDNLDHVRRIECPLLVVHSRQDEMLKFAYAERIFAAAREPKEFLEISGSHNEGFMASGRTYTDGVDQFLGKCALGAPSKAALSPQSVSKGGLQTIPEDRTALDKYIRTSIGWPDGGGSYQGAPNAKDKEHAKSLDPTVLQNVREYLKADELYKKRFPCIVTIVAARPVCGFLLLDLSFDAPTGERYVDGNCHLIYSPRQARVVGKFRWYDQG